MTVSKFSALVRHLRCDEDQVDATHDPSAFEAFGREYLVLTGDEADRQSERLLEESLWAFDPEWLASHSDDIPAEAFGALAEVYSEDASALIKRMIQDWDHFVGHTIMTDGRGHFLAAYDGAEHESYDYFIYRVH